MNLLSNYANKHSICSAKAVLSAEYLVKTQPLPYFRLVFTSVFTKLAKMADRSFFFKTFTHHLCGYTGVSAIVCEKSTSAEPKSADCWWHGREPPPLTNREPPLSGRVAISRVAAPLSSFLRLCNLGCCTG